MWADHMLPGIMLHAEKWDAHLEPPSEEILSEHMQISEYHLLGHSEELKELKWFLEKKKMLRDTRFSFKLNPHISVL